MKQSVASMSECIFCNIALGSEKCFCIAESEHCLAILDSQPLNAGHLLVITKQHYNTIVELPFVVYQDATTMAHHLMKVVDEEFHPPRVGMLVAGFDINHFHLHIMPLYERSDVSTRRVLDDTFVAASDSHLKLVKERFIEKLGRGVSQGKVGKVISDSCKN